MRFPIAILALAVFASTGLAQPAKLADLAWLEGCWEINRPASRTIEKLQDEKRQLTEVVERLSVDNRVADIIVSEQQKNAAGEALTTTLLS